jgi:predicted nucleic acid-binding protein
MGSPLEPPMSRYLLDTCVLVDVLRKRTPAIAFVEGLEGEAWVSVVTAAELAAGQRSREELVKIRLLLDELIVVNIDLEIAILAGAYCRDFRRSHGVEIPDGLIAATAEIHAVQLVTRNTRHFPMLDDVLVPYRLN